MELCAGNLEDYFSGTYNGNMPRENEALLQMSEGMAFIHSKKLVHGELRPSNILISNDSPVQLKLSEFGISEELSQFDETSVIPLKLLKYRAPELFPEDEETMQQTTNKPDAKCDVFAMGCLFHEFVTRGEGHPFSENKNDDVNISLNIVLGKFNLDGKEIPVVT